MPRAGLFVALVAIGAAWGLTLPLVRVAVSTGYRPLGLVLWQWLIMAPLLLALLGFMGKPLPKFVPNVGLFLAVAAFGAVIPGYFTFLTARFVPAGVRGILISLVPMFVLPIALVLGLERPDLRRSAGVLLGAAAIVLIGLPGARVTSEVGVALILLTVIVPFSYALEATYLSWRGPHGLHPFQVLIGASAVGVAMTWPLAEATGQMVWPAGWGVPEWAILGAGLLNAAAYSGYVWLVGQAGSVFASQIAYLVTGFGVVWSKLLLGESYSTLVWIAFGLMLAGIALVQPFGAPAKET